MDDQNHNHQQHQQQQIIEYLNDHHEFTCEYFLKFATNDLVRDWFNSRRLKKSFDMNDDDGGATENRGGHNKNQRPDSWLLGNLESLSSQLTTASKPQFTTDDYVTKDLFDSLLDRKSMIIDSSNHSNSNDSNTRKQLKHVLSEEQLLIELIESIIDELNINELCHKILTSISILIDCDRISLFLVKGQPNNRYLVPKFFDITPESKLDDTLIVNDDEDDDTVSGGGPGDGHNGGGRSGRTEQCRSMPPIPFGVGIVGHVAQTKECLNIANCYDDQRFNREFDRRTGYQTKSLLCQPILNSAGDVIGVAECINKLSNDQCFTENDEKIFRKYLRFCGFSLQNAQLFHLSVLEYKRYQLLLNIAKVIFEDTTNLDKMLKMIINKIKLLLDIDKCRIYLLASTSGHGPEGPAGPKPTENSNDPDHMFDIIFETSDSNIPNDPDGSARRIELNSTATAAATSGGDNDGDLLLSYAEQCAINRKTLNSEDLSSMEPVIDSNLSILSIPIFNNEHVLLGIIQLIKYRSKLFTEIETSLMEILMIFCGLGIQSCLLYENVSKLNAQQQIALEILSYHASANEEEANTFMSNKIPLISTDNRIDSFEFDDHHMTDDETVAVFIRIFLELNFLEEFRIPYKVLCRWILTVRKNYRRVIYHNWRHALNVTQTMFVLIQKCNLKSILNKNEQLALLVASICHDLDHRGTNNSFQLKTSHPLTKIYHSSYMENHHFNCTMLILNLKGNDILQNIPADERNEIIKIIEQCILSTDLAEYIRKNDKFASLLHTSPLNQSFNGQDDDHYQQHDENLEKWKNNELLRSMLMTACDLSAICKPWPIQKRIAYLVANEFYEQGDLEQQMNMNPLPMMDRKQQANLPKGQVQFIDNICLPLYKILYEFWPDLKPLYDGCLANRMRWQELCDSE